MDAIFHALTLPIILPLAGGLLCLLLPGRADQLRSYFAVLVAAATLTISWPLFSITGNTFEAGAWLSLRLDALSAFVLLIITLVGFLIALYSVEYMAGRERQREYFAYLLWTIAASAGVVLANDLILLLVCWGFVALTLYLMIGIAGPEAADAAKKSLMIVGGSDALLIFGAVLVWNLTGSTRMDGGALTLTGLNSHLAFLCFAVAAFAKAGAMPVHSWVPDCGEKADAPVSAFLPASVDKLLGIYLLARVVLDLFVATPVMHLLLMAVGAVTILAAVLLALVQHDLKRLLGYHAVSQVGYMVLGIGTGTAVGLAGALFHMLNNAIYKCALFLCAGSVEKSAGTTDLDRLGGLGRLMPLTFSVCLIATLSISGIPPFNGFASKWMVYQGVITGAGAAPGIWILFIAAAMLGSALTLASFAKVLHAAFLCKPAPKVKAASVRERGFAMIAPMLTLAVLCAVFGVFARDVPLDGLILPVVGVEMAGVWWSGPATVLILVTIAVGLVAYLLTMRAGRLRRVGTCIGGEHMDEAYIRDVDTGVGRHVEVTGVDFYATIEKMPVLRQFYRLARTRLFDIHDVSAATAGYLSGWLRTAHTGVLPHYLTWALFGALALVYLLLQWGG